MAPRENRLKTPQITSFTKLLVRLKIYRNGRNLTQEEVAKKLGVSLRTYQRIEQGTAPLEMGLLYDLSKILQVSYERLACPKITLEDIPNVKFIKSFDEAPKSFPFNSATVSEVFGDLNTDVEDKKHRVKDLHKNKAFRDHQLPFYYSDPNFTWVNKSLAKAYSHGNATKVKTMKNLSDFDFIVRLWEVCYQKNEPWFISTTEHEYEGQQFEVITLNRFTLHSGLPLVFGTVLGNRPKETV